MQWPMIGKVSLMKVELLSERVGLLVIDYQTRLSAAMKPDILSQCVKNSFNLLSLSQLVDIPIITTEQYPQGLGHTLGSLSQDMGTPWAKTHFSVYGDPEIRLHIEETQRTQWVIVGMEAHICVYQSVRDLLDAGHHVWVPRDAVLSRQKSDWQTGLELMSAAGACISSTEAVMFDILKEGRGDAFKAVSRMIR
jgi:isochorismate hydrolase